jgi:hypothetical protein
VITRETVAELIGPAGVRDLEAPGASGPDTAETVASPFAGAQTRVVGVLAVPRWQPGLSVDALPRVYRDIVEVIADAPGPVRAKDIVPRIGLSAETAKIEARGRS